MHDNRIYLTRRAVLLAAMLLGAMSIGPNHAHAAPLPTYLYLNPTNNSCGELWHGDEHTDFTPKDPAFVPLHTKPATDKTRCTAALALMDKKELDFRLKQPGTASPDRAKDPCGVLKLALKSGLPLQGKYQGVCEALGHTYIGKVPADANLIRVDEPARPNDGGICAVTAPGRQSWVETPSLFGLLITLLFEL